MTRLATPPISEPIDFLPVSARRLQRISVSLYQRMIEVGLRTEVHPVELLEGLLVTKMPHNPRHDGTITLLEDLIKSLVGKTWVIRLQSALTTEDSIPEPDLVLAPPPAEIYLERHPVAAEVPLIVEVANTSLDDDRDIKARIYARVRIPVYWIVNLNERWVEVYTNPRAGRSPSYRDRKDFGARDALPLVLHRQHLGDIAVNKIFPLRAER